MRKSSFDLGGALPEVAPNVELIKGWVEATLPPFLRGRDNDETLSFMNADMDTYTPTKVMFENLMPHFRKGSVIVFDELLGFPGWKEHEYRVLTEIVAKRFDHEFMAFCEVRTPKLIGEYIKAAIRIVGIK